MSRGGVQGTKHVPSIQILSRAGGFVTTQRLCSFISKSIQVVVVAQQMKLCCSMVSWRRYTDLFTKAFAQGL